MKKILKLVVLISILLSTLPVAKLCAQENIDNASTYLDSKTASLNKYTTKSQKIQQRLLKKLQRKETKMLKRLAVKDSAAYLQYVNQGLSYDSIATLSKDTSYQQKLVNKKMLPLTASGVYSLYREPIRVSLEVLQML